MCDLISILLSPKNIALCYISLTYITYCYFVVKPLNGSLSHTTEKVLPEKALRSPTSATILMVRHCPWGKVKGITRNNGICKQKQLCYTAQKSMHDSAFVPCIIRSLQSSVKRVSIFDRIQ